jgi:hypothetical protein
MFAGYITLCLNRTVIEVLTRSIVVCALAAVLSGCNSCPEDSQIASLREKGVEFSQPLNPNQVEALTETAPRGMHGIRLYKPDDPEWRELKSKYREGDHFVQFWSSEALVTRTKFYMDGLYLVRDGCAVGWLKGAIS